MSQEPPLFLPPSAVPRAELAGRAPEPEAARSDRLDLLFGALADPTRRAVLARLSAGPLPAGDLARPFGMALPSFMEHLRRLEAGGLIDTWKEGRSRMCRLRPGALAPVRDWIEIQRGLWEAQLDQLEVYLAQLMKESES